MANSFNVKLDRVVFSTWPPYYRELSNCALYLVVEGLSSDGPVEIVTPSLRRDDFNSSEDLIDAAKANLVDDLLFLRDMSPTEDTTYIDRTL